MWKSGHLIGIMFYITPHFAVAVIADQKLDGAALRLCLHGHLAVIGFQCRAQQSRHDKGLRQYLLDSWRIPMRRQDLFKRGAKPYNPAAGR